MPVYTQPSYSEIQNIDSDVPPQSLYTISGLNSLKIVSTAVSLAHKGPSQDANDGSKSRLLDRLAEFAFPRMASEHIRK
jgi:hypothetical protein